MSNLCPDRETSITYTKKILNKAMEVNYQVK
jgi:hypothetical protein